ncbi:hypothetical protein E2C01_000165 [Portunus trituberculatus]|uniref:Uncharacterized protein n=1 Tax=Portunus trituberculatus TaxID=210409 RepID=A0A5B7CFT2_PORTR|nr:hypothetical protein [Portunus trituberculatus]
MARCCSRPARRLRRTSSDSGSEGVAPPSARQKKLYAKQQEGLWRFDNSRLVYGSGVGVAQCVVYVDTALY